MAFLHPLILVSFAPSLFIKALSYAGVMCVVLLMFLPGLMAYRGRYQLKLPSLYQVYGGKYLLIGQIIISVGLLIFAIYNI